MRCKERVTLGKQCVAGHCVSCMEMAAVHPVTVCLGMLVSE